MAQLPRAESAFPELDEAPTAGFWAKAVTFHPCKIIWSSFLIAIIGVALAVVVRKAPDFGNAKLGFEPRGSEFSLKLNAMRQLRAYPRHRRCGDCDEKERFEDRRLKEKVVKPQSRTKESQRESAANITAIPRQLSGHRHCSLNHYSNSNNSNLLNNAAFSQWVQCYSWEDKDYLFCRDGAFQQSEYRPVITLEDPKGEGGDIGSLNKLLDVCAFSKRLKSSAPYQEYGRQYHHGAQSGKCGLYSLPETLMLLDAIMQIDLTTGRLVSGSTDLSAVESTISQITTGTIPCTHLTQQMLDTVLQRVWRCGAKLFDGTCSRGISRVTSTNPGDLTCKVDAGDPNLQQECNPFVNMLVNFVYSYIADDKYLDPRASSFPSTKLTYTNILPPIVYEEKAFYKALMDEFSDYRGNDQSIRIAGVKLDDKGALFNEALGAAVYYVVGSVAVSYFFLVMHTRSFGFSGVVLLQVYCSLGFAYFIQRVVLPFHFFPFLNITMTFAAISIGVDDVFVFMDAYRQSFQILPYETPLEGRLQWVFNRSFATMLVTTLTTSAAFLANIVSPITTIKAFGIFSCLVILVDFGFMMTILPSMLVIVDYTCYKQLCVCGNFNKALPDRAEDAQKNGGGKIKSHVFELLYKRYVSKVVTNKIGKLVFLVLGTAIGITCLILALGLEKSNAEELQLFTDGHPAEDYDQNLFINFRFEGERKSSGLPVRFVSGVVPSDDGNYYDPFDLGALVWADGDLNSKEAQTWFLNLCESFSGAPLFQNMETCVYKSLRDFSQDTVRCAASNAACCNISFPLERNQISTCLDALDWQVHSNRWDGSILRDSNGLLKAVAVSYLSTQAWTSNFDKLDSFVNSVKGWSEAQVNSAPSSIPPLFWYSELDFWDLQGSLNSGAYIGAGVALICCAVVLLMVVGNVIMAMYALISIVWVLSTLVASLRSFGYVLDLMVAVVMAISIGMSVDFVCHMAHAYARQGENKGSSSGCLAQLPWNNSEERVRRATDALSSMGISVTLGAMTTCFGGLVMLLTSVKFFFQFGTFMATTMTWSLLFAVLYFPALAASIGPVGSFGDLWPVVRYVKSKIGRNKTKAGETSEVGDQKVP